MKAFLVDTRAAQNMIQDSCFQVIKLFPGKAILQFLYVDDRKDGLGDCNEYAIIFPVLTFDEKNRFPIFGILFRGQ